MTLGEQHLSGIDVTDCTTAWVPKQPNDVYQVQPLGAEYDADTLDRRGQPDLSSPGRWTSATTREDRTNACAGRQDHSGAARMQGMRPR